MSKTVFTSKGDASVVEKRKHILCADDNEDTRAMMMALLEMHGYQVTTTGNLADALSLTKKGGFDLVILDGIYADGYGVDLCEQIPAYRHHDKKK